MATVTAPNDAYATSQTIDFIEELYNKLAKAKAVLTKKEQRLANDKANQKSLKEQHSYLQKLATTSKKNLVDIEKAQEQLETITNFFESRQNVVNKMLSKANDTAEAIYEATQFIGTNGVERVDEILNQVTAFDKLPTTKTSDAYTSIFITAVKDASSKGHTALNAAVDASLAAYTTLISSLMIKSRTDNYYQQSQDYQKKMAKLVQRISNEYLLLESQADAIKLQLQVANGKVKTASIDKDDAQFTVDQFQAEYNAAQQGASYIAKAAKAAAK